MEQKSLLDPQLQIFKQICRTDINEGHAYLRSYNLSEIILYLVMCKMFVMFMGFFKA